MTAISKHEKQKVAQRFMDKIEQESGPIYGVRLLKTLPFGDKGGMIQAMPTRSDLKDVARISERTVGGFEVLTFWYQEKCQENEKLKALIREVIAGRWAVTELQEAIGELGG